MKKGILVASFGTTYISTREKTIGAIKKKYINENIEGISTHTMNK